MHDMKLVMDEHGNCSGFRVAFFALCQNEASCETIHIKCIPHRGSFSCKSKSISYEKISARTRFETVAQGNSDMAYSFNSSEPL